MTSEAKKPTPDHVHVIIKGHLADAILLARRHQLVYEAIGYANEGREQVGLVRPASVSFNLFLQLGLWFGEHQSAPYPDGALLWWGECGPRCEP